MLLEKAERFDLRESLQDSILLKQHSQIEVEEQIYSNIDNVGLELVTYKVHILNCKWCHRENIGRCKRAKKLLNDIKTKLEKI